MPWRLILFIVIFAVFLAFVTLNLDNRCNINFGFTQFEGVPIFLTVFISFSFGLLCAAPLVWRLSRKKKIETPRKERKKIEEHSPAAPSDSETEQKIKQDAASAKERFFAKRLGRK